MISALSKSNTSPPVFDVPELCQRVYEFVIKRTRSVLQVKREEIIDVTFERQSLFNAVHRFGHGEYARIGFALRELEVQKPGKQSSLPPSAGLGHPVDRFFNPAYGRSTVRS
eukprot:6194137-Pleurochrysis_carterae.AAC.1